MFVFQISSLTNSQTSTNNHATVKVTDFDLISIVDVDKTDGPFLHSFMHCAAAIGLAKEIIASMTKCTSNKWGGVGLI